MNSIVYFYRKLLTIRNFTLQGLTLITSLPLKPTIERVSEWENGTSIIITSQPVILIAKFCAPIVLKQKYKTHDFFPLFNNTGKFQDSAIMTAVLLNYILEIIILQ